jgi:ABC-type spermidine/putrescine transport system permease subunit II
VPDVDALESMPVSRWAGAVRWVLRLFAVAILGFLYLPIAFLVMFSFEGDRTVGFPFNGPSLEWYETALGNQPLLDAVRNSVVVALVVAVVATLVGTMAAFPLVRGRLRWPNTARILVTLPIMLPGILLGVALVTFLAGFLGLRLSLLTVIAGHLVFTIPFVVLIVAARLQGFDRSLEWAAADLGAGPARTMRHVIVPLIWPAILAGALISVTLSIDEFIVTFFTIGPQLTLPIYIYTQIKFGVTPEVNAIATLLLAATAAAFVVGAVAAPRARRLGRRIVSLRSGRGRPVAPSGGPAGRVA